MRTRRKTTQDEGKQVTLDAWDMAELQTYAASLHAIGKRRANHAYCEYARIQGWCDTPAWVPGRVLFRTAHKITRALHTTPETRARVQRGNHGA